MNLHEAVQETVDLAILADLLDPEAAHDTVYRQYRHMRPACQKAFERDYGAKLVPVSFTLEALAADRRSKYRRGEHLPMGNYFLDHHECYNRNGRPWAIVSHTYERDIDGNARQLARDQGLAVFTLPWGPVGWYNPGDAWTFITSRLDDDAPSTWHILLASLLWNRM